MYLRNQFIILILIISAVFFSACYTNNTTNQELSYISDQQQDVNSILAGVYLIENLLNSNQVINTKTEMNIPWRSSFDTLSHQIDAIQVREAHDQALIHSMKAHLNYVIDYYSYTSDSVKKTEDNEKINEFIQHIIQDISQLDESLKYQKEQVQQKNNTSIIFHIGLFLIVIIITILFFERKILPSLSGLPRELKAIESETPRYQTTDSSNGENGILPREFSSEDQNNLKMQSSANQCNLEIADRARREDLLYQSEERYERLNRMLSTASIAWWEWDLVTNQWFYSPIWMSMLGYSEEEVGSYVQTWRTFVFHDDLIQTSQTLQQILTSDQQSFTIEVRLLHKEGYAVPILSRGSITRDEKGVAIRVSGVNTDLTKQKVMEESVRDAQIRFRRLFETSIEGIVILDYNTKIITDANPFIEELLGYESGTMIGKHISEIEPISSIGEIRRVFDSLENHCHEVVKDIVILSPDGKTHDIEFFCTLHSIDTEQVIQCTIRDISERVNAEKALMDSEQRLWYAIEAGEFGVWKFDLVHGVLTHSSRFDQILGHSEPLVDFTLRSFFDHIIPEDRDGVENAIEHYIQHLEIWDIECRIQRPDGQVRWIWIKATPEMDYKDQPVNIFGLIQDITPRKQSEIEIESLYQELEERVRSRTIELQAVNKSLEAEIMQRTIAEETNIKIMSVLNATIDSTEDGIFVIDTVGTITRFNEQFSKIWNLPESLVIEENKDQILEYIYRKVQDPDLFIYHFQDVIQHNNQKKFLEVTLTDGRTIEWFSRPQKIDDSIVGSVWSFRDITSRKKMEKQIEESLQEKEMLLKEIHHRVKNNMQVVSSLLFMQERKTPDPNLKEILRESQNRIRSIALVHEKIYQSKDLNQIDYHDYLLKITRYLFESYVVDTTRITLDLQAVQVSIPIDKAVPCSLIINELLSNSIKYAFPNNQKGTIRISFSLKDETYILVFQDNGIGIQHSENGEQKTLGLELVRGLIRQLNGSIDLDFTEGTTYTITFPA